MQHTRLGWVVGLVACWGCTGPVTGPPAGRPDAAPIDAGRPDASPDAGIDAPPVGADVDGRLTINELMAANQLTVLDDQGAASDWVELYNPTEQAIPLAGYALSDDPAMPRRAVIPAGVVVPAGGHLVLWLDDAPELGPRHLGFELAREEGTLTFSRPDGTPIDRIAYGAQAVDFSAARVPDGSDAWRIEWHATPGAANPDGPGAPADIEDPSAPPEDVPAAGDLSDELLGDHQLPHLGITLAPAAITALQNAPYTYVQGAIVYRGRSYGPVGVRLKGQNSFQPITAKPSFRIKVDEYDQGAEFFGLEDLTLNNMDDDLSMMHERLAYFIARRAGVAASRATHAWVTVNGQPYGLYTHVETIKPRMLRRWFADGTGPLFEATDVDFVPAHVALFEHESGPDDRTLLGNLATALAGSPPDAAIAAAAGSVDLPAFQTFWAMTSVIGQFDSMPYSNPGDDYFAYADPTAQRLRFLPWGMDETFYSPEIDVVAHARSILATTCRAAPSCFQGYVDRVWALVTMLESTDIVGEHARVAAAIAPYVAMDTRKPYPDETVQAHQNAMRGFLANRRATLSPFLPPPAP